MQKRTIIIIGLILLGCTLLFAAPQPAIDASPSSPSTVYVGTPSTVIMTARISSPLLIGGSVNLIRVDENGRAVQAVGSLHDDGLNGDAIARDNVYSIAVQINSTSPELRRYKISAAFRGFIKRSMSLPFTVAVAPQGVTLPPDPGPSGMQTLTGTDLDGDGVRDDVQRWIAVTYYGSAKMRSALTQYAKTVQRLLTSSDPQQSSAQLSAVLTAQYCANFTEHLLARHEYSYKATLGQLLNTYDRARAFYTADARSSGHFFGVPQPGQELTTCEVNPQTLPN